MKTCNLCLEKLINCNCTEEELRDVGEWDTREEPCVWDKADKDGKNMFGCDNSYLTPTNAVKRYKVCPYCGNPIIIKEA